MLVFKDFWYDSNLLVPCPYTQQANIPVRFPQYPCNTELTLSREAT